MSNDPPNGTAVFVCLGEALIVPDVLDWDGATWTWSDCVRQVMDVLDQLKDGRTKWTMSRTTGTSWKVLEPLDGLGQLWAVMGWAGAVPRRCIFSPIG